VDKPPLENIVPETPEEWIKIAKSENPYLRYYAIQKDLAGDEVRKQRAGLAPTFSLFQTMYEQIQWIISRQKPLVM